ncbi:MAG: CAP domain-containing protein [Dermatophilaceae bacterium]
MPTRGILRASSLLGALALFAVPATLSAPTAAAGTAPYATAKRTERAAVSSSEVPDVTRTVKRVNNVEPLVAEAIRLTNVERARAGCSAVRMDRRLNNAARLHSVDMASRNYFSHDSLDGRSPWDRIGAQGYTAGSGENIAAGYTTAAAVLQGWMDSPPHRANLLNCSHKAVGIGIGRGGDYGVYWTQNFGRS